MTCTRLVMASAPWACFIALIVLMWVGTGFASCGSANCFLNTGTQNYGAGAGLFTTDFSYRYILMDRGQRGSQKIDQVLTPKVNFEEGVLEPAHHREIKTINNLAQLNLMYGATQDFALQLVIPFFNQRIHEHFDSLSASDPDGFFTREDGTDGFGDVRIVGRYNLITSTKHLLVGGAGIKLPTGEFTLRDSFGAINEPGLMPGTGSFDALVNGYYEYQIFPHQFDVFVSGSTQITTANSRQYRFGNTTLLNAGLSYQILPYLNLSSQVNARIMPRDVWLEEGVPSTGGEWVSLTPGIRVHASSTTQLYVFGQIPAYQRVNESNLVPSFGLIFGISKTFGLSN